MRPAVRWPRGDLRAPAHWRGRMGRGRDGAGALRLCKQGGRGDEEAAGAVRGPQLPRLSAPARQAWEAP